MRPRRDTSVRCGGRLAGELRQQRRSVCAAACVRSVAQNKVDRALGACQNGALRLLRSQQQRHHRYVRRLARGVGFELVAGGQDDGVLQYGRRNRLGRDVRVVGHQHVEMRAGNQKSGHPYHLVGAQRDGAHSVRDLARKPGAGSCGRQVAVQDGLAFAQRKEDLAANHSGGLRKRAFNGIASRPCHKLDVLGLQHFARLQRARRRRVHDVRMLLRRGRRGRLFVDKPRTQAGDKQSECEGDQDAL